MKWSELKSKTSASSRKRIINSSQDVGGGVSNFIYSSQEPSFTGFYQEFRSVDRAIAYRDGFNSAALHYIYIVEEGDSFYIVHVEDHNLTWRNALVENRGSHSESEPRSGPTAEEQLGNLIDELDKLIESW